MKINFNKLGYSLQTSIFLKLNYLQFTQFEQCCQYSYEMAQQKPHIKFPLECETTEFHRDFIKCDDYSPPIEKRSRMLISTKHLWVKVDFGNEECDFLMKNFRLCNYLAFHSKITCSSQLFVKLVKELKIGSVRWWRAGRDYNGFADRPFDCNLFIDGGHGLTQNELWNMKPRKLTAFAIDLPTIDIIRKLKEHVINSSSNLFTMRDFRGPHTFESVEEALLLLGDDCKVLPDLFRQYLYFYMFINGKSWMVTRKTEKKPFAVICCNGKQLTIAPFPFWLEPLLPGTIIPN